MNMAVKDSVGGWKENAHLLQVPKACSTLKNMFGSEWYFFIKCFGIKNSSCPIVPVIIFY